MFKEDVKVYLDGVKLNEGVMEVKGRLLGCVNCEGYMRHESVQGRSVACTK